MPNFDLLMQEEMRMGARGKLLMHSCCAPCSSACLERLDGAFQTTVFFYNPNLDALEEYEKRKAEQARLLQETGWADLLEIGYRSEEFEALARGYEDEPEGGARCARCFRLRLARTAREAKERGYEYFCTTLTLSPLKNAKLINEIGFTLEEEYKVKYLPSDFKKRGGYQRSLELSREHHLYRQNYCGCRFSKRREPDSI